MSGITADASVGDLVTQRPSRARIFEQFGIDYCCNGGDMLKAACEKAGADEATVLSALAASDAAVPVADERDWSEATMTELADHIEATHHSYLRGELPRIAELSEKVKSAHHEAHPHVVDLAATYAALQAELESHMWKEESILFPMIRSLQASAALPESHCGSVANPIRVMECEHDNAGAALAKMRALTNGYTTPDGVCNTYRALMDALSGLETDLHAHIHKENSILFPKAIAREGELTPDSVEP